jgi:DNA-binding GntR family transcriptional regulator
VTGQSSTVAPPRSRTAWAEARLRQAIVSGELEPGSRVLVESLAERWEISATPVREALRSLAGEGLIVLDPQRGARVSSVSLPDMVELYELRLMLEPYAFRLSLAERGSDWLDGVQAAWESLQLVQSRKAVSPLELEPAHTDFHLALAGGCASASLLRLVSTLSTQALRFRVLMAPDRPGGNRQSLTEHRRLAELAAKGAPDEGARFLALHLGWPLAAAVDDAGIARVVDRLAGLDAGVAAGLAALA